MQLTENNWQWHVCRYDSELWSDTEFLYDAEKKECWKLLKTLKKIWTYLYEVIFVIKLNIQTLVIQLNRSAVNVLKTLINRWLTWIWLFDFNVWHVSEKKH